MSTFFGGRAWRGELPEFDQFGELTIQSTIASSQNAELLRSFALTCPSQGGAPPCGRDGGGCQRAPRRRRHRRLLLAHWPAQGRGAQCGWQRVPGERPVPPPLCFAVRTGPAPRVQCWNATEAGLLLAPDRGGLRHGQCTTFLGPDEAKGRRGDFFGGGRDMGLRGLREREDPRWWVRYEQDRQMAQRFEAGNVVLRHSAGCDEGCRVWRVAHRTCQETISWFWGHKCGEGGERKPAPAHGWEEKGQCTACGHLLSLSARGGQGVMVVVAGAGRCAVSELCI